MPVKCRLRCRLKLPSALSGQSEANTKFQCHYDTIGVKIDTPEKDILRVKCTQTV